MYMICPFQLATDEDIKIIDEIDLDELILKSAQKGVYGAGKAIICAPYQRNEKELQ